MCVFTRMGGCGGVQEVQNPAVMLAVGNFSWSLKTTVFGLTKELTTELYNFILLLKIL